MVAVDIFHPSSEPRNGLVVDYGLPFPRIVRDRDRAAVGNIDCDIFWTNPFLGVKVSRDR